MSEKVAKNEIESKYLETIKELKEKIDNEMISKQEYDKLIKENEKLLNDYINNRPAIKKEVVKVRPAHEIANELKQIGDGDVTNRDFWAKSLEYREAYLRETGNDPWTDGSVEPTAKTEYIASTVKKLLDDYQNPTSFRTQFNETLKDDPQVLRALRSKNKE